MIRKLLALFLVLVMLGSMPVEGKESENGKKVSPRDMATPDGLYWSSDKRLTNDPAHDYLPQLVVDSLGISHVIWYRNGYMYKKIDRLGNELISEKFISSARMPQQYSGYPAPSIAIDSKSCFHIVTEPGGHGVHYAKYDANGNCLVPEYSVPRGARYPHNPSIAVSSDDYVHIIYEDYRWGYSAEGIAYARLKNDGTLEKDGVRISSPAWYNEGSTLTTDRFNNLHAAFVNTRGSSRAGVYHGKLDRYGNPIPSVPPVFLYNPGSFWYHGPPNLACDGLGAVHCIWNTGRRGGVGKIMYLKLDNNGKKLMPNPVVLSTTGKGFPHIVGDSRGNAFAVWADVRNGNSDIYYVKIENGKENDTHLPEKAILLTKEGYGDALEPRIAIDPDDNLHVVWKDNRDGNWEIYYKFAFNYGVELGMTPEELAKVMFVHPNEVKTANMTVTNTGGLNDTVFLNLTTDYHGHEGWKVWIEETEFTLKAQEKRLVKIYVQGPPEGEPNDNIQTWVKATSTGNPKRNSTITFKTYLVVDHRIKLNCPDRLHSTPAGIPTRYLISLENIGDVAEDVNITAFSPPLWKAELNISNVLDLKPGERVLIGLTVTPPIDAVADEIGVVTVTARCIKAPGVDDRVITHTVVSPSILIKLGVDDPEKYTMPGEGVMYEVSVTNEGNVMGTVIVILEIVSAVGDWLASLETNAVGVAGGETKIVKLTVSSPPDSRAGDRLVLRIKGYNEEKTMEDSVTVTTIVKQVHNLQITSEPERQIADPGSSVGFKVYISNLGNGPEEVSMSTLALEVGWDMAFTDDSGAEVTSLYLQPGEKKGFNVLVTVPGYALAGPHKCSVQIVDSENNLWPIDMIVDVRQIYDIDLTTTLSKQIGTPGKSVFFTIIVKNLGNGRDVISYSIEGLPDKWMYEIRGANATRTNSTTLDAGALGRVTLKLTIPRETEVTEQQIILRGTSVDSMKTDEVKLSVEISLSDLYITSVEYEPPNIRAGKPTSVRISVYNKGDVNVENVTVRFYDGGSLVGTEKFNVIPGDDNKTATFNWMPSSGEHTLKFIVDPDDVVVESNEENNILKENVKVSGGGLEMVPGFEGFLLVLVVLVAAVIMRRRRYI